VPEQHRHGRGRPRQQSQISTNLKKTKTIMKKILSFAVIAVFGFALTTTSCKKDPKKFAVTFNSDGGTTVATQTIKDGERATRPTPDPTKDLFNFVHWEQVAGTAFDFNTAIKADITLKAIWIEKDFCQVCGEENCEKEHVKCEICGEWDCKKNVHTWATTTFGTASFATENVWTIINGTITQIWSDALQTTVCSGKTAYNGGNATDGFNIDCRSNPDYKGDLFSWRAASELKDELCPAPWRVPTAQDFIDLDIALGGTGSNRNNSEFITFINENYIARWGGAYGGSCNPDGMLSSQGSWANYWSSSEHSTADRGVSLGASTSGRIDPRGTNTKHFGFPLRCVR
jgi:uncharacterized protein (TIGR02145 family)